MCAMYRYVCMHACTHISASSPPCSIMSARISTLHACMHSLDLPKSPPKHRKAWCIRRPVLPLWLLLEWELTQPLGLIHACLQFKMSSSSHTETVFSCAFKPGDENTLATGAYDRTVLQTLSFASHAWIELLVDLHPLCAAASILRFRFQI
jgi:WD40 repeat protein